MKLNIAYPATGQQKLLEYDDEKKMRIFYDKKIAQEVDADPLGDEWKGYKFKITGGNDKQGFPMMQGVLVNHRVRLLLDKNSKCYRPRRPGERKRKSVRGAIVAGDLSVLSLVVTKKGENDIPGLTDKSLPQRLGPKRASKIRKLFGLTKKDDVRKYVVRRKLEKRPAKDKGKAPKIQRLVTPTVLQRKRRRMALKRRWAEKSRKEASDYAKLLAKRRKEERAKRLSSKRSSIKKSDKADSTSSKTGAASTGAAKAAAPAKGTAPAKGQASKAKDTASTTAKTVKGKAAATGGAAKGTTGAKATQSPKTTSTPSTGAKTAGAQPKGGRGGGGPKGGKAGGGGAAKKGGSAGSKKGGS